MSDHSIPEKSCQLAADLLAAALAGQTPEERRRAGQLAAMMTDPDGKAFTVAMVDQVFRSHTPSLQAQRFRGLLLRLGVPEFLSALHRTLIQLGALGSRFLPRIVMPAVAAQLRRDSAHVILPAEPTALHRYLASRRNAGTRVNLNQLGESVLGEEEAARRMDSILNHLANPEIDYVSVKISAIFSQIHLLDWEGTLTTIKERLRRLYRAALPLGKFVNLDMEEYRDLHLTLTAFQQVLDEAEFLPLRAGVVLQAYLPDSWAAQQQLTDWARRRCEAGGAPIKLRLVKGANLAMELVEAELHGWTPSPYATKTETDANFKRMLAFGCRPDHARAVNLGVASHNLFDIALALVLREEHGVGAWVEMEMLEGMANHQARAVQAKAGGLVVYAPIARREEFLNAMAYLVRRLDENTAPENFLHDLFALSPESPAWVRQRERFLYAWDQREVVAEESRRGQLALPPHEGFQNVADTDWTQPIHRAALHAALTRTQPPSPPAAGPLNELLEQAQHAQPHWEALGFEQRGEVLCRCAEVMAAHRFETIAMLVHDGKKAALEADAEVSEAIDFAHYYATHRLPPEVSASAQGVVVITPPWNFPYAIPCGGVLAALMAGNAVVLKPAPETVATAWLLVQQLWEAGVPREVLQFFPCADGDTGRALITDPRVASVVLTGGLATAEMLLGWRPSLRLLAETSGKNSIIVTAQADRELAIKDLVRSAFHHAGQKCSAASLAILEAEVYDDPTFLRQLRDAAASLRVGPATEAASVVTPLIRPASDALHRALTTLDPGESWLLEPRQIGDDPCLCSPGIKVGVRAGSWFQQTECFGPVLGLIRAEGFKAAMRIQNQSDFGLTAGLHSLDENEVQQWCEQVEAGNAYVNRSITGAIVQRQPFGGWKRSCLGPGAKAGGPNYVSLFSRLSDTAFLDDATTSYLHWWTEYFSKEHDPAALRAESNVLRYRPCRGVILRLTRSEPRVVELARLAARTCGVPLHLSIKTEEDDATFITRLPHLADTAEFFRTITPPPDAVLAAVHGSGLKWIDAPLLAHGRFELPRWLREQSVSATRHRHGQLAEPE